MRVGDFLVTTAHAAFAALPELIRLLTSVRTYAMHFTTFYVRNSVILFFILCLYVVHIDDFVVMKFPLILYDCICALCVCLLLRSRTINGR